MTRRRRDPPTATAVRALLDSWVRTGNSDEALVAADALRERGHEEAANDLDRAVRDKCRDRRTMRERVFSELLNGGVVLERGEWVQGLRNPAEYVLVFEKAPTHWKFRRGVRRGGRPVPRYVLWESYARCRWVIWGTYELGEFKSLEDALYIARADIASMKRRR